MKTYGFSKLAQVYHASELARHYGINAYSLHPECITNTSIQRKEKLSHRLFMKQMNALSKTLEQGIMTSLLCIIR